MRAAGVELLSDVAFEDRLPTYTSRNQHGSDWIEERMAQARENKRRERRANAVVATGGRADEREAAAAATVAAGEQAAAESVLDSRGRRPNYELTMEMMEDERVNGYVNADFVHTDDSDASSSDKEEDSDYEPPDKKHTPTIRRVASAPARVAPPPPPPPPPPVVVAPPQPTLVAASSLARMTNAQKMAAIWIELEEAGSDSD
jgi:hypothetical protein